MLYEYDPWEEGFLFSPALDILLSWGQIHLFHPEDVSSLNELKEQWDALVREIEAESSLRAGLERLEEEVKKSLALLHGKQTVDVYVDDGREVRGAIEILDQVVVLSEALEHFTGANTLPEDFKRKSDDLLSLVTIDNPPSGLRLIPLNDWRRKVLMRIPLSNRYLFPWYGSWADVPANTLDRLVDEWDSVTHGGMDAIGIDQGTLNALLAELETDEDLLSRIRKDAHLAELIPQAIGESLALRLFALSTESAAEVEAPEPVEDRGLVACACKVVADPPLTSEIDRLERLFRAAFCGPVLTDNQRIELFSLLEDTLKKLDYASLDLPSILKRLDLWSKGFLRDQDFAKEVFDQWILDLNRAAEQIDIPIPDEALDFYATLTSLRSLPIGEVKTKEKEEEILDVQPKLKERPEVPVFLLLGTEPEALTQEVAAQIRVFALETILILNAMCHRRAVRRRPRRGDVTETADQIIGGAVISGYREGNTAVLLEDSENNPPELQEIVKDIIKEEPYFQVLVQETDGRWAPRGGPDLAKLPMKIEDTSHDRFVLLIDQTEADVKSSTKVVIGALNQAGDVPTGKVCDSTVVIAIQVKDNRSHTEG